MNSKLWLPSGLLAVMLAVLAGIVLNSEPELGAQGDPIRSEAFFTTFDVTATSFVYCDTGGPEEGQACSTGSAAADGWLTVPNQPSRSVQIDILTINAASLEFVIEARLRDVTTAAQIWPATGDRSETATGSFIVEVPDSIYQMRVGIKLTTDSGAQSVTATLNTFASDSR